MLHFKEKKRKYTMDSKAANDALQNILAAGGLEPVTIPVDVLKLRARANTKPFKRWEKISIFVLILTFLMPFAFRPANVDVRVSTMKELQLSEHHIDKEGNLVITFVGDDVDYENIVILTQQNQPLPVISYDETTGTVVFPFRDGEEFNILIPTKSGKTMHLLISPRK
ncbi:MAG: hypothetical protein K5682_05270 [Lachnospiraceae bacterium]|nr:hypothetical protein [Lachnospiraceae bacterium]